MICPQFHCSRSLKALSRRNLSWYFFSWETTFFSRTPPPLAYEFFDSNPTRPFFFRLFSILHSHPEGKVSLCLQVGPFLSPSNPQVGFLFSRSEAVFFSREVGVVRFFDKQKSPGVRLCIGRTPFFPFSGVACSSLSWAKTDLFFFFFFSGALFMCLF